MSSFNLNVISNYRQEIMGVATLLILLCHAPAHIPSMPHIISYVLATCAYGVDVFLFLSGLGLWYSLSKRDTGTSNWSWYKKRLVRILVPCFIVQLLFISKPDLLHHILFFFGILFFMKGDGFWFVDMLIPLYLLSPFLYIISTKQHGILYLLLVCILCFGFCAANFDLQSMSYIRQAMTRVPSFIAGFMLAKYIKSNLEIKTILLIIFSFIVCPIVAYFIKRYLSTEIMAGPFFFSSIVLGTCFLFRYLNQLSLRILRFLGEISLESYLMNVSLSFILERWLDNTLSRTFIYILTIILGSLIAYLVHIASKRIIKKIDSYS